MIKTIKMCNVASYKHEVKLETGKRINLIYGLNGTGKTTISNFMYDRNDEKYKACSIEELEHNDKILVYNQKFVNDIFYMDNNIPGIFALSKENKDALNNIDSLQKNINELNNKKGEYENLLKKLQKEYDDKFDQIYDETWKIVGDYSGGDRVLSYCLDGHKGSKKDLFGYINKIEKTNIDYTIDQLKEELNILISNDVEINRIESIQNNIDEIDNINVLSKVIVGNDSCGVSELISDLKNSDWVRKGLDYVDVENGICPFCQNKTITEAFYENLKSYFDDKYEKNLNELKRVENEYSLAGEQLIKMMDNILNNEYMNKYKSDIEKCIDAVRGKIKSNSIKINQKISMPSQIFELEKIGKLMNDINEIIEKVNNEIDKLNFKIKEKDKSKEDIKKRFWEIMRDEYDITINKYKLYEKEFEIKKSEIQQGISVCDKDIDSLQKDIEKQKENMDSNIPIDNINSGLLEMGITNFSLESVVDDNYNNVKYILKRLDADGSDKIFETLSEGEKNIISFLYFIELCKGSEKQELSQNNKIIVIDDPISSLSHIFIFNVARLIKNEFFRVEVFIQIFIFTHSLYFFHELANSISPRRKDNLNCYRINNNKDGSNIAAMNCQDIQNDYQVYWSIIKDKDQTPALIANCMRNILDYFFGFVQNEELNNIFQKPELNKNRFAALYRYINRESHSDRQHIFDIAEFDYDRFRDDFKQVFTETGYAEHYSKMMEK